MKKFKLVFATSEGIRTHYTNDVVEAHKLFDSYVSAGLTIAIYTNGKKVRCSSKC